MNAHLTIYSKVNWFCLCDYTCRMMINNNVQVLLLMSNTVSSRGQSLKSTKLKGAEPAGHWHILRNAVYSCALQKKRAQH